MSQTIVIDNLAFAKKNETLAGDLSLADCKRLQALLQESQLNNDNAAETSGTIQFKLTGQSNAARQHFLHLQIEAKLTGTCQRCLNAMPLNLMLDFTYLISDVDASELEESALDEQDDYDLQQASSVMDVIALIEDELIMAMPIAPTHNHDCVKLVTQSGEKPNPFAVLKDLVKK
jgi:uncharacterized protein